MTRRGATQGLATAMDCRALNIQQSRMIFNPSPEVDSLAEEVAGLLAQGVPIEVVTRLTTRCRELLESNVTEGGGEMELAAIFEEEIHRTLLAPVAQRATIKSLAAKLRGPLGQILDPHDGVEYFQACCTVRDILASVPASDLLTASMRHELRDRKFDLLSNLVEVHA